MVIRWTQWHTHVIPIHFYTSGQSFMWLYTSDIYITRYCILLERVEVGLFDCKIIANAYLGQCGFLRSSDIRWCNKPLTAHLQYVNILVSKIVHVMISGVITQCMSYTLKVSDKNFPVAPKFKNQFLVLQDYITEYFQAVINHTCVWIGWTSICEVSVGISISRM
jgi:hypothetical protein